MTNNINDNTTKPVTTPAATTAANKTRVIGSMTVGVPTSDIKFKSLADLKRDFGDNWV